MCLLTASERQEAILHELDRTRPVLAEEVRDAFEQAEDNVEPMNPGEFNFALVVLEALADVSSESGDFFAGFPDDLDYCDDHDC